MLRDVRFPEVVRLFLERPEFPWFLALCAFLMFLRPAARCLAVAMLFDSSVIEIWPGHARLMNPKQNLINTLLRVEKHATVTLAEKYKDLRIKVGGSHKL
jgi:hypothetical protein